MGLKTTDIHITGLNLIQRLSRVLKCTQGMRSALMPNTKIKTKTLSQRTSSAGNCDCPVISIRFKTSGRDFLLAGTNF